MEITLGYRDFLKGQKSQRCLLPMKHREDRGFY